MTDHHESHRSTRGMDGTDLLAILIAGPFLAVPLLAGLTERGRQAWRDLTTELTSRGILAGADDRGVLLVLPGGEGAGLDWARLAVLAGAVMLLLAAGMSAVRQRRDPDLDG